MMRTWCRRGGVVAAVLIVAACGDDNPTTVATTVGTTPAASAPEIVELYRNFEYYGACGNETVLVDGTVFYPVPTEPSEHVVPGIAAASTNRATQPRRTPPVSCGWLRPARATTSAR
jgi:hypothetical protein